ncbi:coiled-coil domain-containing protein 144A-like [Calonectris borealis]|uniref:coiled-coil domain-containing protein 144A-like n=1 Tax=Calonectris borealis TaxID=1323832 RepID=UPI003F4C9C0D
MKRAWRFLRSRRAREGPAASGSSGGDELRPQGREGLCREAVRASESSGGEAEDVRAQIPTAGSDSSPSHLSSGSQQTSESIEVQRFLNECDRRLTVHEQTSRVVDTNKRLSQQLSDAERKASGLEKEVKQLKKALTEKTLALEMAERELRQAQRQAKEQQDLHLEKDQARKDAIKKAEGLQEQLAQLQSENLSLRQQLEDARNKSAQGQMRAVGQLQAELADAFKQHFIAETSLKASTRQCDYLTKENSRLQEDLDKTKAKMCEVSAQLELESQKSLQLEARNQELRRLVALLPHGSATPGAGHTPAAPYGKECERRAQDVREEQYHSLLLQTQAAARAKIEEINTTSASWRKLLEQRIRTLEAELERARSTQEANALQLAWAQAEIKSSEKRSVVDMEIKRHLTKKLQKANEMLAEARAKSAPEQRRRVFRRQAESLSRSRGQSGHPSGSDECKAGSAGDSSWRTPARPPNVNKAQDVPPSGQHRPSTMR